MTPFAVRRQPGQGMCETTKSEFLIRTSIKQLRCFGVEADTSCSMVDPKNNILSVFICPVPVPAIPRSATQPKFIEIPHVFGRAPLEYAPRASARPGGRKWRFPHTFCAITLSADYEPSRTYVVRGVFSLDSSDPMARGRGIATEIPTVPVRPSPPWSQNSILAQFAPTSMHTDCERWFRLGC